jgi:hypothetical protein
MFRILWIEATAATAKRSSTGCGRSTASVIPSRSRFDP